MTWGLIGGAAVTLIGGALTSGGSGGGSSNRSVYDPYAPYRGAAAIQLNNLMKNPGSAADSSYGKAMQQVAARTMAAQGYTGSGNALVASANAGGQAYQHEFNNLAMLSGAGQNPANAANAANQQYNYQQNQNNQMWGQIGSLFGTWLGGSNNPGTQAPSTPASVVDMGGLGTNMPATGGYNPNPGVGF